MTARIPVVLALITSLGAGVPATALAACSVKSGPETAALVELYTSEGCSSCPPADAELRRIRDAVGPAVTVVPLALHVDYWDYIGWKDPFSQPAFGKRQSWLVEVNRESVVYTPHFFVSGVEVGSWRGRLPDQVRGQNARPARADIAVKAGVATDGKLVVEADAKAGKAPAALYLAVTESGLLTKVPRGENAGVTLAHDYVVRLWIGPLPLANGTLHVRREIALPASWNRTRLDVVGFVENEATGDVLQAVSAGNCAAS
jgi:hypothetical protein